MKDEQLLLFDNVQHMDIADRKISIQGVARLIQVIVIDNIFILLISTSYLIELKLSMKTYLQYRTKISIITIMRIDGSVFILARF